MTRVLGAVLLCGLAVGCNPRKPSTIGLVDGALQPCPSSPNCVSSQATDGDHQIAVLPLADMEHFDIAVAALRGLERTEIVTEHMGYVHAIQRSATFGFIDDIELLADPRGQKLHLRSASRTGWHDMGVNRERAEEIRQRYRARLQAQAQK